MNSKVELVREIFVEQREIYCCGCEKKVIADLVDGSLVYPHRQDLYHLQFWICQCRCYVGCHKGTANPLGVIPTKEIMNARKYIHAILDPLWKSGKYKRKDLYKKISDKIGWDYHTAKIRSIEEAREIYKIIKGISNGTKRS
jgi:hypothetical protein